MERADHTTLVLAVLARNEEGTATPLAVLGEQVGLSTERLGDQMELVGIVEELRTDGFVEVRNDTSEITLTAEGRSRALAARQDLAEVEIAVAGEERVTLSVADAAERLDSSLVGVAAAVTDDGVYYVDTFSVGSSDAVTNELTSTFSHNVVITSETLRSRFDLAMDDVEFFVAELTERDLVQRITAGERDYYTIGPRLKEHAENVGFDSQLARKAKDGKISHSALEDIISIAATKDIIRYLEQEGYVIDMDGEYLVENDRGEWEINEEYIGA